MARARLTTNRLLGGYGALFHVPGVSRTVIGGLIGRIPMGMLSITLPLVVVGQTGSYAAAGAVTAAYTIASGIAGPIRGRDVDRYGVRATLLVTGWVEALALVLVRPAIVAVLIALVPAADILAVAAALVATGSTVLALAPITQSWRGGARAAHWLGPLRSSTVRRIIPVAALISGAIAAVELGAIAYAEGHQANAAAGILLSILSVGSILGAVYWGSRRQPGTMHVQLAVLLVGMALGIGALTLAGNILVLGALMVVTGLTLAPAITVLYSLMDVVTGPEEASEAFAWMNAAGMTGTAGPVALAGLWVTSLHDTGGFVLGAGIALTGAVFSAVLVPRLARTDATEDVPTA